jgi:hypothetical protein
MVQTLGITTDVSFQAGRWEQLHGLIPQFKTDDFRAAPEAPANPHMRTVVRLPRTPLEQLMPVGIVSNTYTLAQHNEVAQKCFDGIRQAGIDPVGLRCELGLTELGEWMNLRIYFPEDYSHIPKDGKKLALRLECFNSVDGSSRLVILLGWLRLVCTNGMVIGETKMELRDIHNKHMNLERIPHIVCKGLQMVRVDLSRLGRWEDTDINDDQLKLWANNHVTSVWGKKAACRVFHICTSGHDVEITDLFASGEATDKPIRRTGEVPGAPKSATNLYDVSQVLSWVATHRQNAEERLAWQSDIPQLIKALGNA